MSRFTPKYRSTKVPIHTQKGAWWGLFIVVAPAMLLLLLARLVLNYMAG